MKEVTWRAKRSVSVDSVPDPFIQEPTDAIVGLPVPTSADRICISTRLSPPSWRPVTFSATSRWGL